MTYTLNQETDLAPGRIVIVDPVVHDMEHVPFNASLLATCVHAFPDTDILFLGEAAHVRHLNEAIRRDRPNRLQLVVAEIPKRQATFLQRTIAEWRLISKIKSFILKDRLTILLFSATEVSTINSIWTGLSSVPKTRLRILLCLHSVLAEISGWRSRNPLRRFVDLRSTLSRVRPENLTYIVLEHSIRDEVVRHLPDLDRAVACFPHPISEGEICSMPRRALRSKPHIGFIGLASPDRGFNAFLDTAHFVRTRAPDAAEFHAIGRRGWLYDADRASILDELPTSEKLPRSDYLRRVRDLDYVFLPLPDNYRFSASGTLLDAIAAARPMIGTKLPLFADIEQEFGEIGWFAKLDDLAEMTRDLLENPDPAGHSKRVDNLARVQSGRTSLRLAGTMRQLAMARPSSGKEQE